jgi:hypothetical protein
MKIIIGICKAVRGMGLLAVIAVMVTGVLAVSCLAQLFSGEVFTGRSSKVPGAL